jgi:hypothetical protein
VLATAHLTREKLAVGDPMNRLKLGDQTLADNLLAFEARRWDKEKQHAAGR